MSFFHATDSVFYGKYVRKAVLLKSGNEVEIIGERCREHFARTPSCVLWKSTAVRNYLMKMT